MRSPIIDSKKNLAIVLSAPSGCGKTTIKNHFCQKHPDYIFSVSYTTRPQREGERDGIDYHYISKKQFDQKNKEKQFIETMEYAGNSYGTGVEYIHLYERGHHIIFDVDPYGVKVIQKLIPDIISIFILPPSLKVLKDRLIQRGTEDRASIEKRLKRSKEEINSCKLYKYAIINDEVSHVVEGIEKIIFSELCRTDYRKILYET